MEIAVANLQKKIRLNPPQIIKIAKKILRHEGVHDACLSIVFVSSQKIKALNKKFLNRDYVTDVLAFDLRGNGTPLPKLKRKPKMILGDIIISTDTAKKNAKQFNTSIKEELSLYIVHGILHLLGFDDHKPADVKRMRKEEEKLMKYLGKETLKVTK